MTINIPIILDANNVFDYLNNLKYCSLTDRDTSIVTIIPAKNFNLLINFVDGRNLLIKQEIHNDRGQTEGEFQLAWRVHQLMQNFPDLNQKIGDFLPEIIYFDAENSILVVKYLVDYSDLEQYYSTEHKFPIEVARSIGQLLATIHSQTFQQPRYQRFFERTDVEQQFATQTDRNQPDRSHSVIDLIDRLTRVTPQIFQVTPPECLQFFRLYQRFPALSTAIIDLGKSITRSCLVHHDLKIDNILKVDNISIDLNWTQSGATAIKLIDWERANWGDPAFDLGCLLGSYLEIWLDGLAIPQRGRFANGDSLSINESLQLATTPLELLQPSLFGLVQAYLTEFPAITIARPDYLDRAIQFAGLALIQQVEGSIYVKRTFDNRGIVMMQVAKQLICTPQAAMNTLFGRDSIQLITN